MRASLTWIAALAAMCCSISICAGQERQASSRETAAIRACAEKYAENLNEAERRCIFAIVASPCAKSKSGQSNQGAASCYHVEQDIWDEMLNANYRALRESLDDEQKTKAQEMQRAWIAYRDTTCRFYYDKIQGSMATGMTAACLARETARRALLLRFFQGL
jgi:uncharacterized protein YecT (DUF1311 family)